MLNTRIAAAAVSVFCCENITICRVSQEFCVRRYLKGILWLLRKSYTVRMFPVADSLSALNEIWKRFS